MALKIRILTVMAAGLILASCAVRQDACQNRTVSVSGTGSVSVEADNATIILSVITKGKDVAATSAENAGKMAAVQDAIVSAGIEKDCITTENFSIYQESRYDQRLGASVPGDYRVTNQIKIAVRRISMISEVIDLSLKSGANQLSSLSYGITDTETARKQARTLAIQQAREAASQLALASGARLGRALSISERPNNAYPRTVMMKSTAGDALMAEDASSTPVSGGSSTITISVDAVYQLK